MANAIGTNFLLRYVPEVTWGVTPATPTMLAVRSTSFTPKYNRTTVQSKELTTAREIIDYIRTQEIGGFSIAFEASYGLLDDFLAALYGGAWTTNVLKVGNTRQSFTVEVGFSDIGQFATWTGAVPSGLTLNISKGAILGGTIDFTANPCTWATATGATAVTPAETNAIMDPIASIQLIQQGGAGSVSGPQEFSLAIKNNLIEFSQLSNINLADVQLGQVEFTGTLRQYFSDRALVDIATAFSDTSLALTVGGASSLKYAFLWSKVKLTLSNLAGIQVNSAVIAELAWMAKYDATNSSGKITRTP
jgi:hypothetical protein